MHLSMHVSSVPTACVQCSNLVCSPGLVNHSVEVPLACLRYRGGQVMTLNQVNLSVFFEEMRGIFDMSSNCCMLCGHGSKKSPASSDCPSSIKLLGICHLTVAMAKINTQLAFEYIAAMGDDAFVMRQLDRIRQPSSAEAGADVIKEVLV